MIPYWDVIERIIRESDLVLEILDARLVELSRNERIEEMIEEIGRPMIYVINKSDLVSKESLRKQVENLKEKGEVVFISSHKSNSRGLLFSAIKKVFRKYGKRKRIEREGKDKVREAKADIVVGVLGYPNVGKSSIINRMSGKKKVKVSKKSGTTHGMHWIKINDEIKLIDSPGVIPLQKDDEVRYGLIGAKDVDRLKNVEGVALGIVDLFYKNNKESFEKYYDIIMGNDSYEVLIEVAKKKSYLLKGGELDVNRACVLIIRDWQQGRLRL